MPKISIIVPVYNVEKYIQRCVDSLLAQTFTDFECILIDDGSSDNCPAICDQYAEKEFRIKVIHQKNAGVSAARNAGLDCSKSDYIVFIDSDDWVECNYLSEMYGIATKNDSDIVICGINQENGNHDYEIKNYNTSFENINTHTSKDFIQRIIDIRNDYSLASYLHSPFNKLYKSSCVKTKFDLSLKTFEDYIFNLNVMKNVSNATFLYKSLCFYTYNPNSVTKQANVRINKYDYQNISRCIYETTLFFDDLLIQRKKLCSFYKNYIYGYLVVFLLYCTSTKSINKEELFFCYKYTSWRIVFTNFKQFKKTILLLIYKLRLLNVFTLRMFIVTKK